MIHTILIWCMAAINVVIYFRMIRRIDKDAERRDAHLLKGVALMCSVALAWAGITLALVMAGVA